jgi:hypothetical protein
VRHPQEAHGKGWWAHMPVGVDPRPVAGRWADLCRATSQRGARHRLVGSHASGRRPMGGGWQVGRSLPCASPRRCTAKTGGPTCQWASTHGRWLVGGPVFAMRQTPEAHGKDWWALSCADNGVYVPLGGYFGRTGLGRLKFRLHRWHLL